MMLFHATRAGLSPPTGGERSFLCLQVPVSSASTRPHRGHRQFEQAGPKGISNLNKGRFRLRV